MSPLLFALLLPTAPLLRLEGVDAKKCAESGTIRASFVELEMEGRWRPQAASAYRLVIDGKALGAPPLEPRAFSETDEPLAVGIVLQVNLAWQRDLPRVLDGVTKLLDGLPPRTKVWLYAYGDQVISLAAAATPARTKERLSDVRASDRARAASRQAIRSALDAVEGLPGRSVVVVISDGLDDVPSRDEIRALGNLARARRVPVLPVAYSPTDERGPFLDLAELARRSSGLFRWAENIDDLGPELVSVADALSSAWVIDYAMPEPCEKSHEVQIIRDELRSEPVTILAQEGSPKPVWPFVAGIVGVLLAGAALVITRRRA